MSRRIVAPNLPGHEGEIRKALVEIDSNFAELYNSSVDAPQGRLTLTSGTPVMTATATSTTTLYYTPYCGQSCPIYDGSNMVMTDFGGEITNTLTDATKNPAATTANNLYDLFIWNDNGNVRLGRGPAWTSSSARSLALTRIKGILVNAAAITNGAAQYQGTYVGTVVTGGTNAVSFQFGAAASGGGTALLNVWNYYNRVTVNTRVTDSQAAYAYVTATPRIAGGAGSMLISYVIGVAEDAPMFYYQQNVTTAAAAGATAQVSIGDDATTFELGGTYFTAQAAIAATGSLDVVYTKGSTEPTIGQHTAYALELGDGTNSNLFNVGAAGELSGVLRM